MIKEMEELMDIFTGGGGASADKEDHRAYSKSRHRTFDNLQKEAVLQEARVFHDSHLVREEPNRCCRILAQLLRLKDIGSQPFTETEATEMFFSATKLFVSDDASLRRMTYLFLKEIYSLCDPNNVIIITSSLTKDMTCDLNLYRANSLRVLVRIVDSYMLSAIERYIKQAIIDSSPQVASSALVSAVHLYQSSPDSAAIVRRWISETQQAIRSPSESVQFHAIQLLYLIKSHDRLGVSKLVSQFSQRKLKSPMARVLLVRYAAKLIRDEVADGRISGSIRNSTTQCDEGLTILELSLKDSSDMVAYEAARAICMLPMTNAEDLNPAVNRLKSFLKSNKSATTYASLKTLSAVASRQPRLVSKCNPELEKLLKSKNKEIASLAVTTLLRTGSEDSIDELLQQVSPLLDSIGGDNQISVVKSLLQLCLKYPSKHLLLVSFLSGFLRDQGTFEFKKSIVMGLVSVMKEHPEAADSTLLHLCEYIEDCEYDWLLVEILHVLGDFGPLTEGKQRYIRFIYNRTMLDQPQIRAAAVASLNKFATQCPSLRESILPLLNRSLVDSDDEVRDRATVAVAVLKRAMENNPYIPPADDAVADEVPPDIPTENDAAAHVFAPLPMSFEKLARSVKLYKSVPGSIESAEPVSLSSLPIVEDLESSKGVTEIGTDVVDAIENGDLASEAPEKTDPAAVIYGIPELASFGRVFRSSPPIPLTERETEYVVDCVKHILDEHVILQFRVQNTIEDQRLDNVTVDVSPSDENAYEIIGVIDADAIQYGDVKDCFTILKRVDSATSCSFHCNMEFLVTSLSDGEETGDSYQEEYALEELSLSTADFIAKVGVPDFRKAWESLAQGKEIMDKFSLHYKSRQDAVDAVLELLGMKCCDNTETPPPSSKPHILHLSGVFLGGESVLVRARLSMDKETQCVVLQMVVRCEDERVARMVVDSIT